VFSVGGGNQPKYGQPYQPPKGDGPPDDDKGKDLWGQVPQLAVPAPWNSNPPSFNEDPPGEQGAAATDPTPECPPISLSLTSMRSGMSTIISEVTSGVSQYQDLRNAVWNKKDNVFGQNAIQEDDTPSAASVVSGAPAPQHHEGPSPVQKSAKDFAASINPAQEKVLEQIANALEVVGMFAAGIDRSGQAYGSADRKAKFPEPPPNPINKH
jgi:hypothetical protein